MSLDLNFIRAQFPAFDEPGLGEMGFFENAGGSYTSRFVIDRLTRFYIARKVQPYAPYEASMLAGREMDEARLRLAAMLGVDSDELSFGPSTSQNVYVLAQAFRQMLSEGDAIIVTNQDHEANSGAWRRLADAGIEVREWQIDPDTGHLDPANLDDLLDDKVRLVTFPHVSNIVGEVNDVAAICAKVRAAGAWSCVDGVSYAPHGFPDVGALGADIYMFSAYKTYGPHQGIMTIRRDLGERLPNQAHSFNAGCLYKRFTPAGPDHAQVAASAGMADYVDAVAAHHGIEGGPRARSGGVSALMHQQEATLLTPLLEYLTARNDMRVLGPAQAEGRVPTIALELQGPGEEAAAALAPHGIMAGGGDFYGVRPLQAMGIDLKKGVLRLSFVHYTSELEVNKLIRVLDRVL